ncbi:hypothetical protein FRC12_023714 [Ceratobasidium sp. 428]|nr:hypothetical protein FRC12_023714 [Ceratobasidium sp. 428]
MPRIKIQIRANMHRRLQAAADTRIAPLARFTCLYCTSWSTTASGRTRHILFNPPCADADARDVARARATREEARRLGIALPLMTGVPLDEVINDLNLHAEDWAPLVDPPPGDATMAAGDTTTAATGATTADAANPDDTRMSDPPTPPRAPSQAPADQDSTEQGLDEGGGEGNGDGNGRGGEGERDHGECGKPFVEPFFDPRAGQPINDSRAEPFDLRAHMKSVGRFASPADFEVAELLMTTKMTNAARDAHLKSRKYRGKTPWRNAAAMLDGIDKKLPHGPDWKATVLSVGEDEEDLFVVYLRDVIEVLRELIGNSRFKRYMRYAPEKHWTSGNKKKRVYGEMWTGDWWWNMQELLKDAHATIVPLILASDKTTLSIIGGDQQAYPVYLTIGNISKKIRRKARKRATILIAYLPVESFEDFDDAQRERLKGELVHRAMELVLEPLKKAGEEGVEMYCADGRLRCVYPLLAAYVADYPEQCLMACTSQGRCPICKVTYRRRARYKRKPGRRRRKLDLKALRAFLATEDLAELEERGLKPWWPFWARLPRAEFAGCITPDLLHQIHKGMFKSHLVKWVRRILGDKVVDKRMSAMTRISGVRHFKKGISTVQKWTGRESKEMAMQFLPVVAESMTDDLVRLTRALLDHMYRAHAGRMTEDELEEMEAAWAEFHRLKPALVASGALKNAGSFNRISKLHTVLHWPQSIRELGTPDGYNTEAPEHLHIEYAKEPWRASNGVDAVPQMIKFIQRQEAIRIQRAHLDAFLVLIRKELEAQDRGGGGDDGDEHDSDSEGEEGDDDEWEDVDEGGEETPDTDGVHYPSPRLAIAGTPSQYNCSAKQIVTEYKATDLIPALTRFFESEVASANGRSRPNQWDRLRVPNVSPHNLFNVWHRFALHQARLPFAPDEPLRRDVVRAKPLTRNPYGLLRREAVFDTVLYRDPSTPTNGSHGLHRYRAARVRAIFTPPHNTQHLCPEQHLAYIEFFTPFSRTNNTPHGLYTTSTALHGDSRRRQVAVVPLSHIHMTCHIAPRFERVDPEVRLSRRTDLLAMARGFFYNHYSSYYNYKLFEHWRKRAARS